MADKQLTKEKLAANRRNARKSTGPRTPEGKARVAQNARKHGLTAQGAIVTAETREAYTTYRNQILHDFFPRTLRCSQIQCLGAWTAPMGGYKK